MPLPLGRTIPARDEGPGKGPCRDRRPGLSHGTSAPGAALPPEVIARLGRQLDAAVAELETSLSPALAGELHRVIGPGKNGERSADELRVEYATVLAWTASLLTEVLSQIDDAAARTGRRGRTYASNQRRPAR